VEEQIDFNNPSKLLSARLAGGLDGKMAMMAAQRQRPPRSEVRLRRRRRRRRKKKKAMMDH
jgi:hypothetical protein